VPLPFFVQGVDAAPAKRGPVVFDGAHGIGAPKLQMLAPKLAGYLDMSIRNGVEVGDHQKNFLQDPTRARAVHADGVVPVKSSY
jgi:hypothetical protein